MNRDSRSFAHFFDCFFKDPDPKEYNSNKHRWQWRPISQNPFAERKYNEEPVSDHSALGPEGPRIQDRDAPKWVHLFYDLAWTATFTSLTQNGRFNQSWDIVSYVGFFVLVWWLWAAQAMYTIHFYTNDWFHFASTIVQLCIFGMLAATTRGYDFANYIIHSPGTPGRLEPEPRRLSDINDPSIYGAEVIAATSLKVIAISVTINRRVLYHTFIQTNAHILSPRVVLCLQYLRIVVYARATAPKGTNHDVLKKISTIPLCLLVSIALFVAAWMISTSAAGRTAYGAKLKFILWGAALAFEASSHLVMAGLGWRRPPAGYDSAQNDSADYKSDYADSIDGISDRGDLAPGAEPPSRTSQSKLPIPYSNVTLSERLQGVTTIILGEGINGIAVTLYAVISAPGYEKSVATNAISAAIAVCFTAYFYFEGPTSPQHPTGLRQMIWLFLHLPFLLGIILLLLGVKDQFLLTSFLSTIITSLDFPYVIAAANIDPKSPDTGDHAMVKDFLIKRGLTWSEEWTNLLNKMGPIEGGQMNRTQNFDVIAWQWRLSLKLCLTAYKTFMGETRTILPDIQAKIDLYNNNRTIPVLDNRISNAFNSTADMYYYKILDGLLETNLQGARYIPGLAGGVFILLALLSMAHSKPRDRFQWGIVLSRFAMGWALVFLLLLNLGHFQTMWIYPEIGQTAHQAGVFRWLTAYWILPTIALAHVVQLIIETFITGLAKLRVNEISREDERAKRRAEAVKVLEAARKEFGAITREMVDAAKPYEYVRPSVWELAWREIQQGISDIRR